MQGYSEAPDGSETESDDEDGGRGVYSSLFQYNHIDKKLPFLADFIKN